MPLPPRPRSSPPQERSADANGRTSRQETRPSNVILLIPDGFGPASAALAREYLRHQGQASQLALDPFQVGSVRTRAADHRITDSAAAATAYATGTKTNNGHIATAPDGTTLPTLLETAQQRGMATGLVATSRITHATPAAFSAHTPARDREDVIARQQIEQDIDVMLGGGRRHFLPATHDEGGRKDKENLIEEARRRGYRIAQTASDLNGSGARPLLGLFSNDHMAYELDRANTAQPSLARMTDAALNLLSTREDGFFLMVEGSRIDHAAHDNDPATQLHETLAFDRAVRTVLNNTSSDTLVVAVADHETGGLTLGRTQDGQTASTWYPDVFDGVSASSSALFTVLSESRSPNHGTPFVHGIDEWIANATGLTDLTATETRSLADASHPRDVAALLNRRAQIGWTTNGHTATDVHLYARGPGAHCFLGHHDNTSVGTMLLDLLGPDHKVHPAPSPPYQTRA
jgi:alkaline phosphatase